MSQTLSTAIAGHDARLMLAKYVRPYSKGQKNDFREAEAIAEAVQRPNDEIRRYEDRRAARLSVAEYDDARQSFDLACETVWNTMIRNSRAVGAPNREPMSWAYAAGLVAAKIPHRMSGRPGPVNVNIPYNAFQEEDDVEIPPARPRFNEQRSGASPEQVTAA